MESIDVGTHAVHVPVPIRLDIDEAAPVFSRALNSFDAATMRQLDAAGIEKNLRDLVRLRASQINGCAYCVDMHAKDAAEGGEPLGRIAAVSVWRESPFFTARERAAFALTDCMTRAAETHVTDADWAEASAHLTPAELGALVGLVVVINAWNMVGVTTRTWAPEL